MFKQDKFEVLVAVSKQQKTTHVPYALWKHFVEADKNPENLAAAQLEFQKKFDSAFMKISPHGSYCVVDFGGVLGDYRPVSGSRICERAPIMSLSDWENLEPVDPNEGEFGAQIKAVQLIHTQVENEVPAIMTVFSPFMVASKLDPSVIEHMYQDRSLLKDQMTMLTKLTSEFANSAIDAGANGIFLATQHFNKSLTLSDLQEFESQRMEYILTHLTRKAKFNILHLHGDAPYFRLATEFPNVQAINWHDQTTKPDLHEARQDFQGALLGGLDEMNILQKGDKDTIQKSIVKVHLQFDSRGMIFAPGCVVPQNVSEDALMNVVETIRNLTPI